MKTILILLIGILGVAGAGGLRADTEARPDLTGAVVDADDSPVPQAMVFVYTAGPKHGTSSLCPSCYADCQKKAQTDAAGRFKIESLDPALIFRLLVVASGHESKFVSKVDPAMGAQKIALKPLSEEALKSDLRIKGMVIGERGKPVPGAIISPEGVEMGQGTQWGGTDPFVEPLTMADEQGRFVLFCKSNIVDTVYATAEGRGVARQWVTLKPGGDYLLRLPEGVTVTGQILHDGKPLPGVMVGLTTTDRTCGSYFNCDAVATDVEGHFQLLNAPPDREFVFYAKMDSLHGAGAVPNKIFTTGVSGAVQDLGKLVVQPAFRVAGRIVLSDGKPIPAGTQLMLAREKAWDTTQITLTSDGAFEFEGVPAESASLSVRIKDYIFSKRNPSLDWLNGCIIGRVTGDMTNLDFLMEPGGWHYNGENGPPPDGEPEQPRDLPLRSASF
jgi:hypothetical protein